MMIRLPNLLGNQKEKAKKDLPNQTPHHALVESIIESVTRIKKECKARRYKDLHEKILETETALESFQNSDWPNKDDGDETETSEQQSFPGEEQSLNGSEIETDETSSQISESITSSNDQDIALSTNSLVNETTASFADADITAEKGYMPKLQDLRNNGELLSENVAENYCDAEERSELVSVTEVTEDVRGDISNTSDPATFPSYSDVVEIGRTPQPIVDTVRTLCAVMNHPQKSNKMCELSLQCIALIASNGYISGKVEGKIDSFNTKETEKSESRNEKIPFLKYTVENAIKCSGSNSDSVQMAMSKALLAIMTSPKCGVHEALMLSAIRAVFHVYLVSKTEKAKSLAKATLLDMIRCIFMRLETFHTLKKSQKSTNGNSNNDKDPLESSIQSTPPEQNSAPFKSNSVFDDFVSEFHKDGFLLFRALCKLSTKSLPGDEKNNAATPNTPKLLQSFSTSVDPLAIQSKILSLELILFIFEFCGEGFRKGEIFIFSMQHYLCISLLKNCMSTHTNVTYLSLKIFLALVYNFKTHLKSEIEIFIANIFLRLLESPYSSHDQKTLVLEALRAICSDPLLLTQIFLNYDCDFDAINLYKNIVDNLTRLCSKNPSKIVTTKKDAMDAMELKTAALEILVVILQAFLKALNLAGGDDELYQKSKLLDNLHLDIDDIVANKTPNNENEDSLLLTPTKIKNPIASSEDELNSEDVAAKVVGAFDRKRVAEQNFVIGLVKFNLSLKAGLLFFIENDFLNLDAKEVAIFFHTHKEKLDKTQIGEALGKEPEYSFVKDKSVSVELGGEGFFFRVLHHYVDALDFEGMEFDEAIRYFLSGFRLPGEAQKIDRIMEKFAERYTQQNEEVFASADTAFILGFSVIMLNTDLHNPNIKPEKKMTKESFIKMNRGISVDGSDLPEETLVGIFKRIQAHPFTLKEDDDARAKVNSNKDLFSFDTSLLFDTSTLFGSNAEDRKREKFRKEKEEMMQASEQLFRKRPSRTSSNGTELESVSPADVIKPMFDVTWGPMIATISQVLEKTEDDRHISLCLNGFIFAIRLSSYSEMSVAKDTFISSLAKFTTLGSIKEMKDKNIESIRTLLSIAIIDGDLLRESWGPVLQCISQLGRLQLSASGLRRDDEFLLGEEKEKVESSSFFRNATTAEIARETEENNGRAILAGGNDILMDKVFSSSVNLSGHGILHFIEQLVQVSASEINGESFKGITGMSSRNLLQNSNVDSNHGRDAPRIFSLHRLVEVAGYNMDIRPRIIWTQMWDRMASHFATIGCHSNSMVSMFAIDALRQLSFKFLAKPELSDFNFQRLFLRPFLLIMENPGSRDDIRELVLQCVDNMIRLMSHNLRSGWKIFLSILTLSASDSYEKINTLGLAILQRLLDEHLDQLCSYSDEESSEDHLSSTEVTDGQHLSSSQKRSRNARAEDFSSLCRASLAFVQIKPSEKVIPISLSLRALCHIACYSDLIAEKKVLPPLSSPQHHDPTALGYTYYGLDGEEAQEMALWRPVLDGLVAGMCSQTRSNDGGVGCLIQRASIMTLRAIFLRHGSVFSSNQWYIILKDVLVPAIKSAAKNDTSAIRTVVSESLFESGLEFLSHSLPLPPREDDEGLQRFAEIAHDEESAPCRPFGPAELMVEASFADLRHGGDGNLSQAFKLSKKEYNGENVHDRPFPDSWIATAAPIALGMLTDILCEKLLGTGYEGRTKLWPIIRDVYQNWAIGPTLSLLDETSINQKLINSSESDDVLGSLPCEALVRIGCKEISRVAIGLSKPLSWVEGHEWWKQISSDLSSLISQNITLERNICVKLIKAKQNALGLDVSQSSDQKEIDLNDSNKRKEPGLVHTIFGSGTLISKKQDNLESEDASSQNLSTHKIYLEWGGTLHTSKPGQLIVKEDLKTMTTSRTIITNNLPNENYLDQYIPMLKIRCVASCILQQYIPKYSTALLLYIQEEDAKFLLSSLEKSRKLACKLSQDEDLAHAFLEAWRSEWGDGVREVEMALAAMGGNSRHRGGSDIFFLAQEAGSNMAIIHILSILFYGRKNNAIINSSSDSWNSEYYAEPLLLERIIDVAQKFLASDADDASPWNILNKHTGGETQNYASLLSVVVGMLKEINQFRPEQFARNKEVLFPLLCSLIKAESNEIRDMLHNIMLLKVKPLLLG